MRRPTTAQVDALRDIQAALDERKAIADFLTIRAARAMVRYSDTPIWRPLALARARWTAAILATTAADIEHLAHHEDQARWIGDISGGALTLAPASADRSPQGGDGEAGSIEDESAVRDSGDAQGLAQ